LTAFFPGPPWSLGGLLLMVENKKKIIIQFRKQKAGQEKKNE